ncbi:ROK family protein [Cellulomonas palmilytica]|nr:ROK family protein [Cellulomonas palmilytica]
MSHADDEPTPLVVGVDVGGTKIAAATVDRAGRLGPLVQRPTNAARGPQAVLDAVAEAVHAVVADDPRPLAAVGIGTAGVVDVTRGVIVSATSTFPHWVGTRVRDEVALRLRAASRTEAGPAVHVENDVDAHAAGESWLGAARGASSALLVAVGTGVGGAVVLDGRTWRGAHHVAGEIAHVPVPGAELLPCTCGRAGHLEAIGAGPAIHRRYLALGGDPASPDTRDVVARAEAGEPLAARVVHDAATVVGRAIAGVASVLDPEVVVVSGGVAQARGTWWQALQDAVRAEVVDALADLPVRLAELGGAAPVVGAARGAWALL